MRCPYCKTENPPNAIACGKCGKATPVSEVTFVGSEEPPKQSPAPLKSAEPQPTPAAVKTPGTPGGWSIASTRAPAPALPAGELAAGTILGEGYELLSHGGQAAIG